VSLVWGETINAVGCSSGRQPPVWIYFDYCQTYSPANDSLFHPAVKLAYPRAVVKDGESPGISSQKGEWTDTTYTNHHVCGGILLKRDTLTRSGYKKTKENELAKHDTSSSSNGGSLKFVTSNVIYNTT